MHEWSGNLQATFQNNQEDFTSIINDAAGSEVYIN